MDKTVTVADVEAMPFDRAREAVRRVVASQPFKRFSTTHEDGEMPVAVLTDLLQQALGVSAKTVRLSKDDRHKQLRKGGQEGRDRYDLVQKMIDEGEVIHYRGRAISLYEYEDEWYQAAIQRTKAGGEVYLKSLRRAERNQLERDRRRGTVIQKKTGVDRVGDPLTDPKATRHAVLGIHAIKLVYPYLTRFFKLDSTTIFDSNLSRRN